MAVSPSGLDLRGWIPYAANVAAEDPELAWCHPGDGALVAPFFEQDVASALANPFNAIFDVRTTMTATAAHLAQHLPIPPTAFIFHTGRCGSTLVAQLLATDPANRVLSEPTPLDTVLRAPLSRPVAPDQYLDWIRTTVGALGQATGDQRRLFVKLDSWAVMGAAHLDAAFPGVPWLFVARDPVEVLVSQLRTPPTTLLAGIVPAELFGVPTPEAVTWSRARYGAHVQAVLLEQMTRYADRAQVIVHPELPGAVAPWLQHLGIDVDAATERAMAERARRHGKFGVAYADDRATKQQDASDEVRAEIARAAAPAFAALVAAAGGSV